ncbi:MAG: tRNA lysidine(34) synthetase TilS [bacterium]
MDLPAYFSKNIHKYISYGDTVVIALSGGPDSVALLHLLISISKEYKIKLFAAHFNHKLRGKASLADASFVKKLCTLKGIPFFTAEKDIKKLSLERKGGIEKNARIERYKFLIKCAMKVKADKIAVGHNLDDNAETVFMRIIYGAGSEGLSGISDVRTITPSAFDLKYDKSQKHSFTMIRPLLGLKKSEILTYLKQNAIKFVTDKSNFKDIYLRNKLRNWLIPEIAKAFNPRFKETLASTGLILASENDYLTATSLEAYKSSVSLNKDSIQINIAKFSVYHKALQRRVARMALKYLFKSSRKVGFEAVELVLLCALNHKSMQLPEGYFCSVKNKLMTISRKKNNPIVEPVLIVPENGMIVDFDHTKFLFKIMKHVKKLNYKNKNKAFLDMSLLTFPLAIRFRKAGDKFMPYGMAKQVHLKKFYNSNNLEQNNSLITDKNKVIWITGARIDDRVKVSNNTKNILSIEKIK